VSPDHRHWSRHVHILGLPTYGCVTTCLLPARAGGLFAWTVLASVVVVLDRSERKLAARVMARDGAIRIERKSANQDAAANRRRPAGQSNGSGNLSAIVAADRAFSAAVAQLAFVMADYDVMIQSIAFLTYAVSNITAARHFYEDVLGLTLTHQA